MPRLPLKSTTVKRLFALSGNECAYPPCQEKLVNEKGVVIGEICHIESAEIGGERYNYLSNDEYRRSYENLILLCSNHHKVTNDEGDYTVDKLKKFKSDHEAKYDKNMFSVSDETVELAIKNYMEQSNKNEGSGTQFNNLANNQSIGTQIGTQNIFHAKPDEETIEDRDIRPINKKLKEKIDKLRGDASPPKEDVIDFRNDLSVWRIR